MRRSILFLAILSLVAGGAAFADHAKVVTFDSMNASDQTVVVVSDSGPMTLTWTAETVRPVSLQNGDRLVVRMDDDGNVTEILRIDESVLVTEERPADRRFAVAGSVKATGPSNLILNTMSGATAFVLRPEKLGWLPGPKEQVAVIYRVQERAGQDDYIATELVKMPAGWASVRVVDDSPIVEERVATTTTTTTTIETEPEPTFETETETGIAAISDEDFDTEPAVVAQVDDNAFDNDLSDSRSERTFTELPQTAGTLPMVLIGGLIALCFGAALRFSR